MKLLRKCTLAALMAVMASPSSAAEMTLNSGETLDWATLDPRPTRDDTLTANGGAIVNLSGEVLCRIELSGDVQVSLDPNAATPPRFYSKLVRKADGARLVVDGTVELGGVNGAYGYADDDIIAFADTAAGARLVLAGGSYTGFQTPPQLWALADRIDYGASSVAVPFGTVPMRALADGVFAAHPATTGGTHALRVTRSDLLPAAAKITIPAGAIVNFQPMTLTSTLGASTVNTATTYALTNDVELAGGRLDVGALVPVTFRGDFTGSGRITVDASTKSGRDRRFEGSLEGMDAGSVMTIGEFSGATASNADHTVRLSSGFPGTVVLEGSCASNRIDFGVTKFSGDTAVRTLEFGAIQSVGTVTPSGTATFYGPMLQFNQRQRWHVGTLSGSVSISPSQNLGGSELAVDTVADGTDIWIRYGMKLVFGTVGRNVRIHYMSNSTVISNVVEVTNGGALAEIELRGTANTVRLNGVSVEAVTGAGRLEVVGGACRLGTVADAVSVDVGAGSVEFGSGVDLSTVLGARPALWFDASNLARMEGTYNSGWVKSSAGGTYTNANPLVKFRRAGKANQSCVAWTNGFPLVEKWFDTRADQNANYLWQYRCHGYSSTLYTLVYPYLVPNGLNGRPYMSFGEHGTTNLSTATCGTSGASTQNGYRQERRRTILMRGAGEGGAVNATAAIMVFGSQNGGGRAILGGYANSLGDGEGPNGRSDWVVASTNPACTCHFKRGGGSSSYSVTNSILDSGLNVNSATWLNGRAVDATRTGMSGGWDILSVTNAPTYFRSLGQSSNWKYSGGQNYAELIVFTNALQGAERQAVEEYLAVKWGLPHAARRTGNVTVAKGALATGLIAGATGAGVVLEKTETGMALTGDLNLVSDGTALAPALPEYASLALPTDLTVNLDLAAKLPSGSYTIASAGTLSGADTITVNVAPANRRATIVKRDNALVLTVSTPGMVMLVK